MCLWAFVCLSVFLCMSLCISVCVQVYMGLCVVVKCMPVYIGLSIYVHICVSVGGRLACYIWVSTYVHACVCWCVSGRVTNWVTCYDLKSFSELDLAVRKQNSRRHSHVRVVGSQSWEGGQPLRGGNKTQSEYNRVRMLSCVQLYVAPRTAAYPFPLSIEILSRQEYWSGLPFHSPGDLPDAGIKPTSPASPAVAGGCFITAPKWGKAKLEGGWPGPSAQWDGQELLGLQEGAQAWGRPDHAMTRDLLLSSSITLGRSKLWFSPL